LALAGNSLKKVPGWIRNLTSLRVLWLNNTKLTSVPAWIGELTSLKQLDLSENLLASVPEELGDLRLLTDLDLTRNTMLTSMPTRIDELRSRGCNVHMDDGVIIEEDLYDVTIRLRKAKHEFDH